jgi:hypothetical protein
MRLTTRSRTIATLAVALTAAALVPAVSAGYRLTHQEAARLAHQSGQSASPTPGVRPNPDQQTTQSDSVGPPNLPAARKAELAAISQAEAQRETARNYSLPPGAHYTNAPFNAYATLTHPVTASTPTVKAPDNGFDYRAAAAVGAALAATIIVVMTAGGLAARRRRQPQSN